jgi:hypothetical protein
MTAMREHAGNSYDGAARMLTHGGSVQGAQPADLTQVNDNVIVIDTVP